VCYEQQRRAYHSFNLTDRVAMPLRDSALIELPVGHCGRRPLHRRATW
jgi:hypothetical protein